MKLSAPYTPSERITQMISIKKAQAEQLKREKDLIKVRVDDRTEIMVKRGANIQKRIALYNELNNRPKIVVE
jgi:hypothetical protein